MAVHRAAVAVIIITPQKAEQHFPGKELAAAFAQRIENFQFLLGQRNRMAVDGDPSIRHADAQIIKHKHFFGGVAIETLTKQIIDGQTLAVDTIAGATYTTYGFTAAVADAVTKAGLDAAGMGYVDKSVVILPACMRIKDMLLKNNFHYYNYTTANVCSEYITFAIYEPDMTVWDVRVYGGCHGTADAFGALCKGLTIDECIERLGGIQCSGSATGVDSCPDQVAQALTAAKGMLTGTLYDGCNIQH